MPVRQNNRQADAFLCFKIYDLPGKWLHGEAEQPRQGCSRKNHESGGGTRTRVRSKPKDGSSPLPRRFARCRRTTEASVLVRFPPFQPLDESIMVIPGLCEQGPPSVWFVGGVLLSNNGLLSPFLPSEKHVVLVHEP